MEAAGPRGGQDPSVPFLVSTTKTERAGEVGCLRAQKGAVSLVFGRRDVFCFTQF